MRRNNGFSRWDNQNHPNNFHMPYHQNQPYQGNNYHNHPGPWTYNGNAAFVPQYSPADQIFHAAYQSDRVGMPYYNNFYQDPYFNRNMNYVANNWDAGWNINTSNNENGMREGDLQSANGSRQEQEETVSKSSDDKKRKENPETSQSKDKNDQNPALSKNEEARRKLLGLMNPKQSPPTNNKSDQKQQKNQKKNDQGKRKNERLVSVPKSATEDKQIQKDLLGPPLQVNQRPLTFSGPLPAREIKRNQKGLLGPPPEVNRRMLTSNDTTHYNKYKRYNNGENFRGSKYDEDNDDESNEINSWLQQSKGKETVNGKNKSPVSTDPLPGSEAARSNAIKEATDRLKQALQQKKNEKNKVNVNDLLSSGDEGKSENPANSKFKAYPKNLALLELDASDMREIGMANTDKTSCLIDENSDDDIIEVQRPPTPPRPIIDLDSPMKDDENGSSFSGSSDIEEEAYRKKAIDQIAERSKDSACLGRGSDEIKNDTTPSRDEEILLDSPMKDDQNRDSSSASSDSEKEAVDQIAERSKDSACLGRGRDKIKNDTTPSQYEEIIGESEKVLATGTNEIIHSVSNHEASSFRSCQETLAPSGRVSSCRRSSTEVSANKALPTSSKPTSPPITNQRRRSSSSSSSCKTPSPLSSRSARSHQQNPENLVARSPPFNLQGHQDSRQRKIISGLQKMSRSKLKDLIENPRNGKYEFAVRELVKEHRAALSKESRDFAEKMIPAEVLNPKHTELPPDDSTLLADYEIDWSQLSEGLISTLGDLMQDFESESEEGGANELLLTSNQFTCNSSPNAANLTQKTAESTNSSESYAHLMCMENTHETLNEDNVNVISREHENIRMMDSFNQKTLDRESEVLSQSVNIPTAGRIRVCQFASINNLDFREKNETSLNLVKSANPSLSSPAVASVEVESEVRLTEVSDLSTGYRSDLSESATTHGIAESGQPVNDTTAGPTESSEAVPEAAHFDSLTPTLGKGVNGKECLLREEQGNNSIDNASNGSLRQHSSNTRNLQASDDINQQDRPISNKVCDKLSEKASVSQGKEPKTGKGKQKQRKFVHLEERSWFQDVPAMQSVVDDSESSARKDNAKIRTTSQSSMVMASSSNIELREPEVLNVTSSELDQSHVSNDITSTTSVERNSSFSRAVSTTSVANDMPSVDRDGISMLPVLMMTVSANALSDTVCNMTPSEMQKRILEIDTELQNLVQERFLLSQALKVSQSTTENVSSNIAEQPTYVTVADKEIPSIPQSRMEENISVSTSTKCPDTPKEKTQSSKRKRSNSQSKDGKQPKKKKSRDKAPVSSSAQNQSGTKIHSDCFVRLESICPNTLKAKLRKNIKMNPPTSDVIVIDDDGDNSGNVGDGEKAGTPPTQSLEISKFKGIEGTVLDIKLDRYHGFFAASQNGQVFMISKSSKKAVAVFGEKNPSGITCIETVHPFNLYTGSMDGILRIYNYQDMKSKPQANSSHNISNGIHCMAANWDFVYIGTKTGCVIPFDTKTLLAGQPLNIGGYPVLSIKTSMEGPRKVLIVASRQQPIAIRDATSGLLLRSIGGCDWTVYSMQLEKSQIFCGSASDKISVFDFQSGELKYCLQAGKGVVDMKFSYGVLFCACYDGKIYVFDPQARKLITSFYGPGKLSLCLAIYNRKIICSSKDKPLTSYTYPREIKAYIKQNMKITRKEKKARKLAKLQEIFK